MKVRFKFRILRIFGDPSSSALLVPIPFPPPPLPTLSSILHHEGHRVPGVDTPAPYIQAPSTLPGNSYLLAILWT